MTVRELVLVLAEFPPDAVVRYEYDGGHSYPTFERALLISNPDEESQYARYPSPFVCLYENPE